MKRTTLKDVARAAGVSHMTVSRVVRGAHLASLATREKVLRAIDQTGYKPDPALSALAAYRTKEGGGHGSVLAFLDCDRTPYSQVVLEGVKNEALLLGYTVELFPWKPGLREQERLGRVLYHRGIRGLLFGPSDQPRHFEGWNWEEFAMVSLGALGHSPAMHSVAVDYFQGAMGGYELLWKAGCRRIALVLEPRLEARTGHRWLGGYKAALVERSPALVYGASNWEPAPLKSWVRDKRVDGVLTIHDQAWAILRTEAVRLVFLNDQSEDRGWPWLKLDPRHLGAEGLRLLHHSLLRREFGIPVEPKMVALRGAWAGSCLPGALPFPL